MCTGAHHRSLHGPHRERDTEVIRELNNEIIERCMRSINGGIAYAYSLHGRGLRPNTRQTVESDCGHNSGALSGCNDGNYDVRKNERSLVDNQRPDRVSVYDDAACMNEHADVWEIELRSGLY
jgi:hypothetical protein